MLITSAQEEVKSAKKRKAESKVVGFGIVACEKASYEELETWARMIENEIAKRKEMASSPSKKRKR